MYESSPFLIRRVLGGVVLGAAVLALCCLGWAQYRISQYHDQESRIVNTYRAAYQTCLRTQGADAGCAGRITRACTEDAFWSRPQPFTFGLGSDLDESSIRCVFGAAAKGSV